MSRTLARTRSGRLELLYEPRDCWVGVYWHDDLRHPPWPNQRQNYLVRVLYVCLLPTLPIRIEWRRE